MPEFRSTVWLDWRKGSPGWTRIWRGIELGAEGLDGGFACGRRVGAEGSCLDGEEAGAETRVVVGGVEFALEKLANQFWGVVEGGVGAFGFNVGDVADQDLVELGGEAGGEVADLVGMGEDDVSGVELVDELMVGGGVPVGGVVVEEWVVDGVDGARGLALDSVED